MSYTVITQPYKYMHGYSNVPLRVVNTAITTLENYQYLINIMFDKLSATTFTSYAFGINTYTKLTFATAHPYKLGDTLFIKDSTDLFTDFYTVMQVLSTTSIIIDLNYTITITPPLVYHVIPYKLSPDPDGHAKLDLGNTLKNYVTQNLHDLNDCFAGDNTKFSYEILCGSENKGLFTFHDNSFEAAGAVGFVNSALTATTQVQFSIGDEIIIKQDLYAWQYQDNFFSSGNLGFTGITDSSIWESGDTINVTGQITRPDLNGITTIKSVGLNSIVTNKGITSLNTPVEGGVIYGTPLPEYNVVTTITNIVYSAGTGVIIVTDIPFSDSSPAIGGTIKASDGKLLTNWDGPAITGLSVFNSYVTQQDYTLTDMDKFILSAGTHIYSSIYTTAQGNTNGYRVEGSTKGWLLIHNSTSDFSTGNLYYWLNEAGNSLGFTYLPNISSNKFDYYTPLGIDQIRNSTNRLDYTGVGITVLSGISNSDIIQYLIQPYNLIDDDPVGQPLRFNLNDDCSRYEIYHLMWKDKHGSWISFPFNYVSVNTTDVDRKQYYRTAGNWNNNSFGFDDLDRGETSYFVRARDKVLLNSGWITEAENILIKDLMMSASVYVQTPDNILLACTIQDKSLPFGKNINDGVFQYKFEVTYSNDEVRF